MWTKSIVAGALALVATSCVESPETTTSEEALLGCPFWGCGENTPVVNGWTFSELDLAGAPNDAGISLAGLVKNGQHYQPTVDGDRLRGKSLAPKLYADIEGYDLVGATLLLRAPDMIYPVVIDGVYYTDFFVAPGAPVEALAMYVDLPGTGSPWLCKNLDGGADAAAILFRGDRYDPHTKEVIATGDDAGTWFNIACAGSALAKLHLNRHTEAGSDADHTTTLAQRQALLKMYVADYCGTGESFTLPGEPLHWANREGWSKLDGNETFESYWDAGGALCLDEARLEDKFTFSMTTRIIDACAKAGRPLDPCPSWGDWPQGAELATGSP